MKPQVLSHGELLIDFSQQGIGPLGFPAYEALPGGGVANLAVALAHWGHPVAFGGRVGSDALGSLLRQTLRDHGVDTSRLSLSTKPTTMAIVSNDSRGERSFDFLWKDTSCEGIPVTGPDLAALPRIFHFSSVSMSDRDGRRNNLTSARLHKEAGCVISFDPNLRLNLWPNPEEARVAIREGLALADVVKVSEEEVAFILDEPPGDRADQSRRLKDLYGPTILFVTLGPQGCLWFGPRASGAQGAPLVQAVDTTGAGDCFMAGALHVLLGQDRTPSDVGADILSRMAAFGVATGSLSTTKRGGIPSIPSLDDVQRLLA